MGIIGILLLQELLVHPICFKGLFSLFLFTYCEIFSVYLIMKYSNYVGVLAAIILIGCCFLPWVYIDSIKTTITGLQTEPTRYGKPGILHIAFSLLAIVFFLIPALWAKRTNLFIGAFNFAWGIRNFLIISHCEFGECPQKRFGIYAILLLSVIIAIMTTIPKMKLKD
jgi:hypothetical protein